MSQHVRAAVLLGVLCLLAALPAARADELCATSPLDTPPPGGGVVNTYYPGTAPGQITPGTTSIPVGTPVGAQAIATGDLLLLIQMQDATINTQNDDRYGDATASDNVGSGMLDPRNVGKFEYVVALGPVVSNAVPVQGEGPDLDGPGVGNPAGIINTYTNADPTASEGARRYQVIRIPRYASLDMTSLTGGITAGYWDGAKGGVLSVQVAGTLTLSNTNRLSATNRGFRGGMGQRLQGVGSTTNFAVLPTAVDYRYPSLNAFNTEGAHGNKGEGIAGTPRYMRNSETGADIQSAFEGYPGGSRARGAPGNAGGGGTDSQPSSNNNAAGGGGGGNGGPGGKGGDTSDNQPTGGHGGAAFVDPTGGAPLWGPGRLVMGGGGGGGVKDDSSPDEAWGGPGGGIIMIHVGSFAGTGTIESNGTASTASGNDGGGGGGAGGSILLASKIVNFTGVTLTVNANGGNGADAGSGASVLGPGGGGGGGVVLMTPYLLIGSTVTVNTTQGASGLTDAGTDAHGSTSGTVGTPPPGDPSNPFVDPATLIPGADSIAECEGNAAPVNTVPGAQATLLSTPLIFSTANGNVVSTTDADSDPDDVEVTISVTAGTLTVDGAAVGLTSVVGNGTATVVLTGTWAEINDALNPLTYTPTGIVVTTSVTFQIVTNDLGNNGTGGPQSDTDTVTITVGNQNLPPQLTVPGAQVTAEDTALVFSFNGSNRISVTDPDSDPNPIQVTLSVTDGTLTLANTASLATVSGNGTGSITMTGTLAALAAALGPNSGSAGLSFAPSQDFVGSVTLTVAVDDLGWSLGGVQQLTSLTDQGTVTIDVTGVNDAPVAVNDSYEVGNNTVLIVTGSGLLGNDSDVEGQTLTAVLVDPPSAGDLVLNSDGTFTYTPLPGSFGLVTFTYQATDGTALSNVATVSIDVTGGGRRQRAGYCGLMGLEVFAVLAALRLRRRRSSNR